MVPQARSPHATEQAARPSPGAAAPDHRFPKSRRILKRRDFLRIQDRTPPPGSPKVARVTTPHFVLLLARREPKGSCRLGVVASKKVGGAVARNRIKRLLREAFRLRAALFPDGVDLVLIARPGAPDLSFSDTCRELEEVRSLVLRRALEVLRK